MAQPHPAVGIDLGTTNSTVAFVDPTGRPETIRNAEGGLSTPSAVFFDRSMPVIGAEAMEAGVDEPERLALFAKRDVGEQAFRKSICGASIPPEVLQALVLRKLKQDAELKLGPIEKAVITVPAFFNEPCRKSTQDAGRLAGLEVLDIINEPTAAAICFGVQQGFLSPDGESQREERVLVYDLGGGTFDVTVMELKDRSYQTIATNGDVYLGGVDWDRRIVDFIADAWLDEYSDDLREDPVAEQLLLRKANQTKHALTQRDSVPISFAHQGQRIRPVLNREQFQRLTEDLLERTLMTVGLVLDEASMTWGDLTRLILVGGSTRMPMIRDELSRLTSLELDRSLSPDEAVAHGAAIYAGIRLGQGCDTFSGVSVTNVNSHDLGVLAKDPKTGEPRRQIMIKRNTTLPARQRIRFRTHEDNQQNVKVQVVEGGDDKGRNATKIGKCLVESLPADTPKGTFVDVQFDYSQDGRLTVSATLPTLRCKAEMTMNRAAGMSEEAMAAWHQRIEDGISEATLPQVLELAADSDEPAASDSSGDVGVIPIDQGNDDENESEPMQEEASAFPGIQIGDKSSGGEKAGSANKPSTGKAWVEASEIPDFTSSAPTKRGKSGPSPADKDPVPTKNADPTKVMRQAAVKPPNVKAAVEDGPARKRGKEKPAKKRLLRKAPAKPSSKPKAKDQSDAQVVDAGKATELPPPKKEKGAKQEIPQLPPGLADLAGTRSSAAKEETLDFNGIGTAEKQESIDFTAIDVETEKSMPVGGSELNDFFTSQASQEAAPAGSDPAPTINVQGTTPPKKLQRSGARKSKQAAPESGGDSDWKRRGKRISSENQELDG